MSTRVGARAINARSSGTQEPQPVPQPKVDFSPSRSHPRAMPDRIAASLTPMHAHTVRERAGPLMRPASKADTLAGA